MKAASRLLLPLLLLAGAVRAAEVTTSFSQTGINTQVNFMMTNNDPGAIYNSAELRLETILAPVFDAIQRFKPGISTRGQVYATISHSIQPSPIGEVYNKWFHNLDSNTGVTALYHQGIGFTTWQNTAANASQDMMALTLNLGSLLDFNGNSLLAVEGPMDIQTSHGCAHAGAAWFSRVPGDSGGSRAASEKRQQAAAVHVTESM